MAKAAAKAAAGFWMINGQKRKEYNPYNPYDLPEMFVGRIFLHYTPVMIKSFCLFNANNLSETIQQEIPLKDGVGLIDAFILGNT